MSDEQGVEAVEVETEVEIETEVEEVEQGDESEVEEAETEEVVIDYEAKANELEAKTQADRNKINKQRAALSQTNSKIQELNAQLSELQKQTVEKEPNVDDFETFEDFDKARFDFVKKQALQEASEKVLKQQQQQAFQQKETVQRQEFDKAEAQYRARTPEYDAAKENLVAHSQVFPLPPLVINAIEEQARNEGMLPDIIAYYGSNLDEFDTLSDKSPIEAAIEVYKVSQKLKVERPKQTKPLPKPIKSIKGTAGTKKALHKMSYEELKKQVYKE